MKVGQLLGERYEILSQLGGGGMAIVYKAKCTLLQRIVTIKVLRPEFTSDPNFVTRFRNEAQAVARLSHPNIVNVYDVGQEQDIHYFVMEYIEGHNLKEAIQERGPLPLSEVVNIGKQICEALGHAHDNGIIHRDIKPHNILLAKDGRVKVTDFGIARAVTDSSVTQHGTVLGSVHYISPEQAKGQETTTKSDLYSAGVVLFEMLTGKVPFKADTPVSVALKHIQERPPAPSEFNSEVPLELDKVVLRAMEKDPTIRYQFAQEMAADLTTVLQGRISDDTKAVNMDEFVTKVMPVVGQEEPKEPEKTKGKKKKKKRIRPMAFIVIPVIIAGLLAGLAYGFDWIMSVPEVEVPNVIGMSADKAAEELKAVSLKSDNNFQFDSEVGAGNVISQDPKPGETIKENRTVSLYISKGPEMVKVPDVRQKDADNAQFELESAGFRVDLKDRYHPKVVEGAVISQIPKAGEDAAFGSTVTLDVSKGPEPKYVIVPNLIGLTIEEAKEKLVEANLELNPDIEEKESFEYEEGIIIKQDPVSGQVQILEGDQIRVVVSKGPGAEKKIARVHIKEVPNDGKLHTVKIIVTDIKGTREVYNETLEPGQELVEEITYFNEATIQVWMDGNLLAEEIKN